MGYVVWACLVCVGYVVWVCGVCIGSVWIIARILLLFFQLLQLYFVFDVSLS